jgi:hypothetical protein
MTKKKRDYIYIQLIIGIFFTIYGLFRLLFGNPTIGFSSKYFQPTINSGTITLLILGIGFLIGFAIKFRQKLKNNEANSKKGIKK